MKADNELIAEFMGDRGKILRDPKWIPGDELVYLRYHLSWDWLIPVVEKIESDLIHPQFSFAVHIGKTACDIVCVMRPSGIDPPEDIVVYKYQCDFDKIEMLYKAVVLFIKWYNSQSKPT